MDEIMNIHEARNIVETEGWDGFLNYFSERYPDHEFYSASQSWYDDGKYICKLRGAYGDLIVGWVNDN